MNFYFPLLGLTPSFTSERVVSAPFTLSRRLRKANLPDLSTLGAQHKLHFPFQFADALLSECRLELCVDAPSLDVAKLHVSQLRMCLYLNGASPFSIPFAATHSSDEYAGISSRSRPELAARLPAELQSGPKSEDIQVEMWPHELSLSFIYLEEKAQISESAFQQAAESATFWKVMEGRQKELVAFREAAESAPMLMSSSQSYLHIWCGLEALFPKVGSELSFRLSIYLAQLVGASEDRRSYHSRFKKSYDIRSKVAHGSRNDMTHEEWEEGWILLVEAGKAILKHRELPSDNALLCDLLQPPGVVP
ncbi:Uncharacterised protein [Stutzerimonas stutzeri]|nr:Uncharacterised protein [Stutzerimonas stutzeri]